MNPDIQRIAEKWTEKFVYSYDTVDEAILKALTELSALRDTQERELRDLIKKSDLVEVDSCVVASDSCGAPVLRNSGKILRHRGYMSEVNEKTKLLQQLAAKARSEASLRAELEIAKKAHKELLGRYLRVQDELVVLKGCSRHGTNWDPECLECDSKCPESERGKQ